jgi:hypothetical protein
VEGEITFQIDGQPETNLKQGDAFFEPANRRVFRFDNTGPGRAKFVAFYLLERRRSGVNQDDYMTDRMLSTWECAPPTSETAVGRGQGMSELPVEFSLHDGYRGLVSDHRRSQCVVS